MATQESCSSQTMWTLPVQFHVTEENGAWLTEDGRLMMCQDTLLNVFPYDVTVLAGEADDSALVLQVVSGICGSVSVICLAATFLTYSLFSELRSLPGLNNMSLALSLALAQITLLLPWHRTRSEATCRVVGAMTHWMWLLALCWMGVCCVHMVRVFTSSSRHTRSGPEACRIFLRALLFTLLFPTSVVALNLAITASVSGGQRLGYGGAVCFLESSLHVGLAFLLPLAVLVTTNMTCFVFTVVAIMRVRRLQANNPKERSDVLVYAKLATVTGGAWTLGLVAEATDQNWLRVLGELCTASQGLLLFLSYVCNRRVLNMYRKRLGCVVKDGSTTAVTTMTTKLTAAEADTTEGVSTPPLKNKDQHV